jgi:hypothetical protein
MKFGLAMTEEISVVVATTLSPVPAGVTWKFHQ